VMNFADEGPPGPEVFFAACKTAASEPSTSILIKLARRTPASSVQSGGLDFDCGFFGAVRLTRTTTISWIEN